MTSPAAHSSLLICDSTTRRCTDQFRLHHLFAVDVQGSFPAGTPGNGVPKVILTVGTAFPGTQYQF